MIIWWAPLVGPPIQTEYLNARAAQRHKTWHNSCELMWQLQR